MSESSAQNNQEITAHNDSITNLASSRILEFIKNNPFLTLLNVGLMIGGILAYAFFAKINYLPEFDLQNATTLLIGIALVGIAVTLGLGICFILPSVFIQNIWRLIHPPTEDIDLDEDSFKEIKNQHSYALSISSTLAGIVIVAEWILIATLNTHFEPYLLLLSISLPAAFLLFQYWSYKKNQSRFDKKDVEKIYGNPIKFICSNFLLLAAWIIPGFILILILAHPFESLYVTKSWYSLGWLIFSLIVIIVNNSILAAGHISHKPKGKLVFQSYVLITFSCLIVYANLPNNQTSLINVPFQILHLGNVSHSVFVVNSEDCKMLNTLKTNACFEIKDTNLGCVVPKRLASRIGTEYLLIFDANVMDAKLKPYEITIPLKKDHVLGWSFDDQSIPESCKDNSTTK